MIETIGMRKADEFVASYDSMRLDDPLDRYNIDELVAYKLGRIKDDIESLQDAKRVVHLFDSETPSLKSSRQQIISYSEFAAWQAYVGSQSEEFQARYYEAEPFSPYYLTKEAMETLIAEGVNEPSDKDIWSIAFLHPDGDHFYEVKYVPGKGGNGWRYYATASNVLGHYENIQRQIASGRRYPLLQTEP